MLESDRLILPLEIERSAPERLPLWDPGMRGGVPEIANRLVVTADYVARHPDFTTALNAAIAAVPAPGAVLIPGRTAEYEITGPVHLRSGVVLRGEGITKTTLRVRMKRAGSGIEGSGNHPAFRLEGERVATMQIAQALQPGDRAVELEPHPFGAHPDVGQLLMLSMENDPAHGWNQYDWEQRVRGQPLSATAIHDNRVSLDGAVRLAYALADYPEAVLARPIEHAGMEDMRIVNDDASEANWTVTFWRARNCWLRNVEIERVPEVAVWVWGSRWVTLEGCHIHTARTLDGGKGYGVNVCGQSGDCLVTDCIFEALRHSMLTHFGASGNVFAYNTSLAPAMSDLSLHGWYGYMNLFEGNVAAQAYVDNRWGRSGEYNTFFRNRLAGFEARYEADSGIDYTDYADHMVEHVQVDADSNQQNILGNTLLNAQVILRGCADTWVEKNLAAGESPGEPIIVTDDAASGTVDVNNFSDAGMVRGTAAIATGFRPSMHRHDPPDFWLTEQTRWPATGSDVDQHGAAQRESLPAEDRRAQMPWRPGFSPRIPVPTHVGPLHGYPGDTLRIRTQLRHMAPGILIRAVVDWGDGSVVLSDLVASGAYVELSHAYFKPGTYRVTVQARDQFRLTSRWSSALRKRVDDPD
jgi:hypothetical protein